MGDEYSSETEDAKPKQEQRASRTTKSRKRATRQTRTKEDKADQTKQQATVKKTDVKGTKAPGAAEAPSLRNGGLILRTPGVTDAIHASKSFYEERVKELTMVIGDKDKRS